MRHAILSVVLLLLATAPATALEPPVDIRELNGEALQFTVNWTGIPAAEATLCAELAAPDRMKFTSTARSYSAVRLVYPLDSKIVSEVLLPTIQPISYSKTGKEGWGTQHDRRIAFDHQSRQSLYYRDEKLRKIMEIPPGVQDPLSCFYIFRAALLKNEDPFLLKVSDGSVIVDSTVRIVGREKITVPAGTYDTIIIEPNMEGVGGVFSKSPGSSLRLWLTDDKWRRPVKMYSKVIVGNFTAVLERISTTGACGQGK